MLRTTIDVFELGDGSVSINLATDRIRPGDHATDYELRTCKAIHAAMHSLMDQDGTLRLFEGAKTGAALPRNVPVTVGA